MGERGVLRTVQGDRLGFWCPGCDELHVVYVGANGWTFNGDYERPTFSPSVKVTGVQPMTDAEYVDVMRGKRVEPRPKCCHSFVEDGKIKFLGDCTHDKAGQTVDLSADGWRYEP